jgi:hypothetical protein
MPGTQPRGTHAFDPATTSSSQSATLLDLVDTEEEGAEDQLNPIVDSTVPPLVASDPISRSGAFSSIISSFLPPDCTSSSSSSRTKPPPSSSLPPTVYYPVVPRDAACDISMGSTHSLTSLTTGSDAGSSQLRKRKHSARSASGMEPPHSKRASTRSKTNALNPVVITTALNSTLNRMVDVMERTLDATTVTTAAPSEAPTMSMPPPSIPNSSIESSQPLSASTSSAEVLDQAVRIISGVDSQLTEDQLLSASLFFSSASDDAVRVARTFIALQNSKTVQYRFLLNQLATMSALSGKGKGKAVEVDDFMET